jgi:acetylornithine deacetylase/succinyl-diaminopimelate desuccinylase-like protein
MIPLLPNPERIAQWTLQLCRVNSTTGQEELLIPLLSDLFWQLGARVRWQPVSSTQSNLLATWGDPELLFTTHLDTVPPYLPPRREGDRGPERFPRVEGFPMAPVPFGSDAPTLRKLADNGFVVMTGPGSIQVTHTDGEYLDLADAVAGAHQYLALARLLLGGVAATSQAS